MSSKIEQLLQKLCPNGVTYKALGEVCNIHDNQRRPITRANRVIGQYPYYGANGIQDYVADYIFDGDYVLVGEDGSVITKAGTPIVTWASGKIWVNNHAHVISEKEGMVLRFLFHYLQTVDIKHVVHGTPPKFTGTDFKKVPVPIPPIEIQKEIVNILDKFSEYTTELNTVLAAELTARKKQYECYRQALLELNPSKVGGHMHQLLLELCPNGVEYKTIGEILGVNRGKRLTKKDLSEDFPYFVYHGSKDTPLGKYKDYNVQGDTVIVVNTGGIGGVKYCDDDFWCSDGSFWLGHSERMNTKFVYHYVSQFENYFFSQKRVGGVPTIDKSTVEDLRIPVPPIEIQNEIVRILDKFSEYTAELAAEINAEIEACKQQYEYYRDKLLSFAPQAD